MAIDQDGADFLHAARRTGVDFRRTCTIGRQRLATDDAPPGGSAMADPLFAALGAEDLDAMDASDYEGATVLHDLNTPDLPTGVEQAYTAVVDGGSLEHVFHVPNALAAMMRMVAPGGHLLMINPTEGQSGHGFYQFSAELFHRVLGPESGFAVEHCLLKEYGSRRPWFSVPDPATVGRRVLPRARGEAYLYVIARRVDADRPVLATPPQQSDYAATWEGAGPAGGRLFRWARSLPTPVQRRIRNGREAVLQRVGPRATGLERIQLESLAPAER